MAERGSKEARREFGLRLKAARQKKQISQRELAKAIGVSHGLVAHWEAGRSSPNPEDLAKIRVILEADLDEMLGVPQELRFRETELTPEQAAIAEAVLDQLLKRLTRESRK